MGRSAHRQALRSGSTRLELPPELCPPGASWMSTSIGWFNPDDVLWHCARVAPSGVAAKGTCV
jgi:hypothetical protein